MSSVHYELCSTAGLQAVTDTPDSAAATLVRHLSEVGSLGAVDWMITGPQGRIHHGRFEPPPICRRRSRWPITLTSCTDNCSATRPG